MTLLKQIMFAAASMLIAGCAAENSTKLAGAAQANSVPVYDPYSKVDVSSVRTFTSPEALVAKVKSLGGEQGKFEKDSDFFARARFMPFEACYEATDASFKYDSASGVGKYEYALTDAQILGYRDKGSSLAPNVNFSFPSIFLSTDTYGAESYVGSNAFGVKVDIAKADLVRTYLVFDPYPVGDYSYKSLYIESEPIRGEDIPGMKVCVTSVPVEPYFMVKRGYHEPTVNVPIDGKIDDYFFRVKIAGMSLVSKTGKLYALRISSK